MAKTATTDWNDVIKLVRSALFEKRPFVVNDSAERNQVQKCLDVIQKSIKITSLTSMKERLEAITRQLGLKLKVGPSKKELFIFTEMFLVEIQLNPDNGQVQEVKISHQSDPPVSCLEITEALNNSDFTEFTKHLDELSSLYQLNADKKQKQKAYQALHSLETDLSMLAQLQSSINDPNNLVHKSPVGILEPRKGGHPMKLTYFISPYDLLDLKTKSSVPLTIDVVVKRKLGYSAAVCIESSSSHKLQTVSLISITKTAEGKSLPQFAALSNLNSSTLPACFVLRLPKQLPMSIETLKKIQAITGIEVVSSEVMAKRAPLVNLIAKSLLTENESRRLSSYHGPYYVQLPDQCHSYYMNDSLGALEGVEVSSIPFTHPTYVPQILIILRQQVLFNVVICSCIRRVTFVGDTDPLIFEVTALSMSTINVSFEHPVEESLATTEFDLRDITSVKCKLHDPGSFTSLCSDEFASKVMQRCFSIPVTMRAIISKCQENAAALKEQQQKQKTRVLQQRNQKDLFFNNLNGNSDGSDHGNLPPYLSQLNSNQYPESMKSALESDLFGKGIENGPITIDYHTQHTNFATPNITQSGNHQQSSPDSNPMSNSTMSRPNSLPLGNGSNKPFNQQANYQQFTNNQQIQHMQVQMQMQNVQPDQMRQRMALQGTTMQSIQHQKGQQQIPTAQQLNRANQQQRNQMLMQQSPQNKQNAMLMSMLSDVPAANSSQLASINAYNQAQQAMGQMQGQSSVKPKTQRKRKGATDSGNKSPGSSTGRSPKRKMSEDDFSRELSTPNSDPMDSLNENHIVGYNKPPSVAPNTPGYDSNFSNTSRSLESLLTGPRIDSLLGNNSQNLNSNDFNSDNMNNYQFINSAPPLNRSTSFSGPGPGPGPGPGSQAVNPNEINEFNGFEANEFSNSLAAPVPNNKVKRGIKRMKSSEECNENNSLITNQVHEDGFDEQQLIIKSLQDLHQLNIPDNGPSKAFTTPAAKSQGGGTKSPMGSNIDGRRCISAGGDGNFLNKRGNGGNGGFGPGNGFNGTLDEGQTAVTIKKERKRRRAESIDSIKAVAVSTTSAILMPPPMITSTGEIAGSGGNAYGFMDICSNGAQQGPITINTKPLVAVNNGNSNGPTMKSKKLGISSSGLTSPKTKLTDRSFNKSPKGLSPKGDNSESNGGTPTYSPKSSPKTGVTKSVKISRGADSSSAVKATKGLLSQNKELKSQNLKNKSQNPSTSSTVLPATGSPSSSLTPSSSGVTISKTTVNLSPSPPVSSSSSMFSVPPSPSNSKAVALGNTKSVIAQKRRQGSLSAVIDKLTRGSNPIAGDGGSPTADLSNNIDRETLIGKPENCMNKPDSSSGKSGANTGVSSSINNKIMESKVKYSRTSDQFTIKPNSSNTLKFTINKTKPSSSMAELKSRKFLSTSMSHKAQNSITSAPNALKTTKNNSQGLKRQLGAPAMRAGQNFKTSSGVSSSSSGQINSPKTGLSNTSKSGISSLMGNRGANKVSSSNLTNKQKITSPEAIIDAAIPRIRIDHLPKIPRTASSLQQAAASNSGNVLNNAISTSGSVNNSNCSSGPSNSNLKDSGLTPNTSNGPSNSVNTNQNSANSMVNITSTSKSNLIGISNAASSQNVLGQPTQSSLSPTTSSTSTNSLSSSDGQLRKPITSSSGQRDSLLLAHSSSSMPTSSEKSDHTSMKFQSCTISSSLSSSNIPSTHSASMSITLTSAAAASSSSGSSSNPPVSASSGTNFSNSTNNLFSGVTSSVLESDFKVCDSNETIGINSTVPYGTAEKNGVSSSSDEKLSTSTPSSPIECPIIPDVLQKPPPLIPTESIDEPLPIDNLESQLEATLIASSSTNIAASSSETSGLSLTLNKTSSSMPTASSTSGLDLTYTEGEDDDDDEEGLIIDFASSTPTKRESTSSNLSTGASLSSFSDINVTSASTSSQCVVSQQMVQASSSLVGKEAETSTSPSSISSNTINTNFNASDSISTEAKNGNGNTMTGSASSSILSCSTSNPVSESPSSQSVSSLISRRSPCMIDDDLMDEALVGSGE